MISIDVVFNAIKSGFFNDQFRAFTIEEARKVNDYHKSIPFYKETPLISLRELSTYWGISNIFVKDESFRFGLNSFKLLGGSYAIGKLLSSKLKLDCLDFNKIMQERDRIKNLVLTSATDGNHGRGVAWTAEQFGLKSVIYMPKGSAVERIKNIEKHGAKVIVTDLNYDDTIKIVRKDAKKNGWIIVQDTAWEDYEEIPLWIMQGYLTLVYECYCELAKENIVPSHVFLQAGVGAFAGAAAAFFYQVYGDKCKIIIIEPEAAPCLYESIKKGTPQKISGELNTIMAGLACGEVNPIGWEILKNVTSAFIKCKDYLSANGMRILSNPLKNDKRVISGESGAVSIGVLDYLLNSVELKNIKNNLNFSKDTKVLVFSTEGATDYENFEKIVWYGKHYDPNY